MEEVKKPSRKRGPVPKNDTKNIPKNFGKAIINFYEKNPALMKRITQVNEVDYKELLEELTKLKPKLNTISDLRKLWVDHEQAKCLRVISELFLRRHCMHYIFNSRVWNYKSHIKYKTRFREALKSPDSFSFIKEF